MKIVRRFYHLTDLRTVATKRGLSLELPADRISVAM
jgi:hypothetical protein